VSIATTLTAEVNETTDDKGYTGAEQITSLELVHLNGRVYDPLIARFLSGDPHVTDPKNGQNYNRYSYVLNNPMNMTDPTGFDDAPNFASAWTAVINGTSWADEGALGSPASLASPAGALANLFSGPGIYQITDQYGASATVSVGSDGTYSTLASTPANSGNAALPAVAPNPAPVANPAPATNSGACNLGPCANGILNLGNGVSVSPVATPVVTVTPLAAQTSLQSPSYDPEGTGPDNYDPNAKGIVSNIPFNASGGAGGGGNLGPIVQSADSGVIADTNGNVCVYHSTCSGSGWNTPVGGAIGGTFTFGAGGYLMRRVAVLRAKVMRVR
jgi:RHS repeat-associated protein